MAQPTHDRTSGVCPRRNYSIGCRIGLPQSQAVPHAARRLAARSRDWLSQLVQHGYQGEQQRHFGA